MRRFCIVLFAVTAAVGVSKVHASEGVDDVLKLASAGLSQDVMMAFVQTSSTPFNPTADEIKTLRDGGVSATVIVAMIDHGKEVNSPGSTDTNPTTPSSSPSARPASVSPENGDAYAANSNTANATNASYQPSAPTPDYAGNSGSPIQTSLVAPPAEDANISYFYETMAPHGTWHQTAEGNVWRPNVVNVQADWRPYANDGHWVWTDAGWYWESSYPWGWAAFHYGRWHNDASLGWVWSPDTTWGPAWVNWRHNDSYYGWAPLPPEARFDSAIGFSFHDKHVDVGLDFGLNERDYAFVPSDRFLDVNIGLAVLPRAHVSDVYRQTTVINNTYIYNHNRIINNGVPFTQVEQRTQRKLDTVRIADARFSAGVAVRGEVHTRGSIAVFRPTLSNVAPRDPAAAISRGTYVRRDVVYTHVTAEQDRVAERRLVSEISYRGNNASARGLERSEPAKIRNETRRDTEAERRVDSEIAQRERAPREEKQQTALRSEAHGGAEPVGRERQIEHVNQAREEAAAKHADRADREDAHPKKKKGHDE